MCNQVYGVEKASYIYVNMGAVFDSVSHLIPLRFLVVVFVVVGDIAVVVKQH